MTFIREPSFVVPKEEILADSKPQRCFPVVPKLACTHLGLDLPSPSKPISLLGGLTSFGGAGNNYSMHVSEFMRQTGLFNASVVILVYFQTIDRREVLT